MTRRIFICLCLIAATAAVYWQVGGFEFVHLDDPGNIADNPLVNRGLAAESLVHAMTTSHPDYWRPMTWLSLMIDFELHGLNPGGYHLTNVLLHMAATLLLFLALDSMTAAPWRSGLVAALFALHPLHVESVAWVTERKDVLSATFGFASLWAYSKFARGGVGGEKWLWYVLAAGLLGLGLMAKPMLVTLPFVMLLLDLWPLRRLDLARGWSAAMRTAIPLVLEKVPLVVISAASCFMTMRHGSRSLIEVPPAI